MMRFLYVLGKEASFVIGAASLLLGIYANSQVKNSKESEKRKTVFKILRAISALLVIGIVILYFVMLGYSKVPNVVSLPRGEAISRIFSAELTVDMPADVPKEAAVIKQTPEKSEIVKVDSSVKLEFKVEPTEPTVVEEATTPNETEISMEPVDPVQTPKIGGTVLFGTYQQSSRNADPIEWKVLDVKDNKALLLSSQGLDCIRYNEDYSQTTWATCTLRLWLNTTFLNTAFSGKEQKAIIESRVDNSALQGNTAWSKKGSADTSDRIFLLSYAETNQYLKDYEDRVCSVTDYAISQYADTKIGDDGNSHGFWWLRSPGEKNSYAAYVNFNGECYSNAVGNGYISVRPVLWVDCEEAQLATLDQ